MGLNSSHAVRPLIEKGRVNRQGLGPLAKGVPVRDQELRVQARQQTQNHAVLVTPFVAPRHLLSGTCPATDRRTMNLCAASCGVEFSAT